MPLSNNILIKTLKASFFRNIDKENFDELSKFVKFVKIFLCQNFMLYGILRMWPNFMCICNPYVPYSYRRQLGQVQKHL